MGLVLDRTSDVTCLGVLERRSTGELSLFDSVLESGRNVSINRYNCKEARSRTMRIAFAITSGRFGWNAISGCVRKFVNGTGTSVRFRFIVMRYFMS